MGNALFAIVMLLSLVVLVLTFAVIALARQIGILHTRLAPAGALMTTTTGPKVGEAVKPIAVPDIKGEQIVVGKTVKMPQLVLFVSPTCPICKELVPAAKSMARSEKLSLVFASDGGEVAKHEDYIKQMGLEEYPYVVSLELGLRFEVQKLPYAVLIDESGVLRSKGLVNSREHLESLVNAMQSGYESIQDFLVGNGKLMEEKHLGEPA